MNWYKRQIKLAMPAPIKWTSGQIEEIKKMIDEGKLFSEIGRVMGVGGYIISRLNNKYKWREKAPFFPKREFSSEEIEVIKSLIEEGHPYKDVASLFNVSRTVIERINKEHGWREKRVPKDLSLYKDKVLDLYLNQGYGIDLISQYFNGEISTDRVKAILVREGKWKEWDPLAAGEKIKKNRWDRLGGWDTWISQFSPEKKKEIQDAMHHRDKQRQEGQFSV
jgi:hypothetical protein